MILQKQSHIRTGTRGQAGWWRQRASLHDYNGRERASLRRTLSKGRVDRGCRPRPRARRCPMKVSTRSHAAIWGSAKSEITCWRESQRRRCDSTSVACTAWFEPRLWLRSWGRTLRLQPVGTTTLAGRWTSPRSGGTLPAIIRRSLLFPEAAGPTTQSDCPEPTAREIVEPCSKRAMSRRVRVISRGSTVPSARASCFRCRCQSQPHHPRFVRHQSLICRCPVRPSRPDLGAKTVSLVEFIRPESCTNLPRP